MAVTIFPASSRPEFGRRLSQMEVGDWEKLRKFSMGHF